MAKERASIVVGSETFGADVDAPFVFGRADASEVVGLDANDMGISGIAGSIESAWGVWWVVNQSTKRPLLIEHPEGPGQVSLAPGRRYAVTSERVKVVVAGAIYSHVIDVVLPRAYVRGLGGTAGRLTTGTLVEANVRISERERDALTALCSGFLAAFPHRREHPLTYDEAARWLRDDSWSADRVRKAVERVKQRFADKEQLYFTGPQANYELARYLITTGVLSGEDLVRIRGGGP